MLGRWIVLFVGLFALIESSHSIAGSRKLRCPGILKDSFDQFVDSEAEAKFKKQRVKYLKPFSRAKLTVLAPWQAYSAFIEEFYKLPTTQRKQFLTLFVRDYWDAFLAHRNKRLWAGRRQLNGTDYTSYLFLVEFNGVLSLLNNVEDVSMVAEIVAKIERYGTYGFNEKTKEHTFAKEESEVDTTVRVLDRQAAYQWLLTKELQVDSASTVEGTVTRSAEGGRDFDNLQSNMVTCRASCRLGVETALLDLSHAGKLPNSRSIPIYLLYRAVDRLIKNSKESYHDMDFERVPGSLASYLSEALYLREIESLLRFLKEVNSWSAGELEMLTSTKVLIDSSRFSAQLTKASTILGDLTHVDPPGRRKYTYEQSVTSWYKRQRYYTERDGQWGKFVDSERSRYQEQRWDEAERERLSIRVKPEWP